MDSPTDTPPTGPQSPAPEPERKRLFRTSDDRVIAGVCGGIARHLGVDSTLVRVIAVVLVFAGGAGALAYIAAVLLIPGDPSAPAAEGSGSTLRIVGVVLLLVLAGPLVLGAGLAAAGLLLPLAVLALMGLAVWWLVSGEGPGSDAKDIARRAALGVGVLLLCVIVAAGGGLAAGLGGGTLAATLVIGAGVLLVAGAFVGGARWLIPPALSLALAVGFVSAAGIDLDGGVGERDYRPTSAAQIRDGYELGMGQLTLDLRDAALPRGDTPLDVDIGVGEARLIVPEDVCVATSADVGIGAVTVFDKDNGGIDLDWSDQPRAASDGKRLVVNADVGIGHLDVRHDDDRGHDGRRFGPLRDDPGDSDGNTGCRETRAAR